MRQRRLRLASHVMRHDEAATLQNILEKDRNLLEKDRNLSGTNLIVAMKNRNHWKEIIMSLH